MPEGRTVASICSPAKTVEITFSNVRKPRVSGSNLLKAACWHSRRRSRTRCRSSWRWWVCVDWQRLRTRPDVKRFRLMREVPTDDVGPTKIVVDFLSPRDAEIVKNRPPIVNDFVVQRAMPRISLCAFINSLQSRVTCLAAEPIALRWPFALSRHFWV